jgi:creatinine amidohydrolase
MKLFTELNREQLSAEAPLSLVVLPLGATEQHGPHLPTGTDYFTIEMIAREAAVRTAIPVIVAPALPFGSSDHHLPFGGTLSFHTETYYRVVRELVESLVTGGFTRIFLLNGHSGNQELAELAARDVALMHPVRVAAGSYWTISWEALTATGAHRGRLLPGHAGDFETSLMLSLRPDLVCAARPHRDETVYSDAGRLRSAWRSESHGFWKSIDGFTDSPAQATAERGAQFREIVVMAVAEAFTSFYNA